MPPPKPTHHWFDPTPDRWTRYRATDGPCGSPDPFECWLLEKLATDARVIVEIGTWRGRSATFLWNGLVLSGREGGRLVCVDHFKGDTTGGGGASREETERSFRALGVGAEIVEADALTVDWSRVLPTPADLVFYDGDHTKGAMTTVLTKLHPHVAPFGRVAVHDAHFPEVSAAISLLTNARLYHETARIDVWEGFSILQRTHP